MPQLSYAHQGFRGSQWSHLCKPEQHWSVTGRCGRGYRLPPNRGLKTAQEPGKDQQLPEQRRPAILWPLSNKAGLKASHLPGPRKHRVYPLFWAPMTMSIVSVAWAVFRGTELEKYVYTYYIHAHIIYMHEYMFTHAHTCICIHIYMHMYDQIHMHTQTY